MKKHLHFLRIICTIALMTALPSASFAWGPDVIVNPVAGRYYSAAKVSVAYDGTIYYGRLYSEVSASGQMRYFEVLKSVDNGLTFTFFIGSSTSVSSKYIDLDILAVGNDAATFRLFVARTHVDTVSGQSMFNVWNYDAAGNFAFVLNESYTNTTERGWGSISMASDYREKSTNSSP